MRIPRGNIIDKDLDDIKEYIDTIQNIVSDYFRTKFLFKIDEEKSSAGHLVLKYQLESGLGYPNLDQLCQRLMDNFKKLGIEDFRDYIKWDQFYNLKLKLSLLFIFGEIDNEKQNLARVEFLNNLINISSKTYESSPTNIGVIYCEKDAVNELEGNYNIDIIYLSENMNIRDFFKNEKPFLKLVDGESINLLVNNLFEVYGIVRSNNKEVDVSHQIIRNFENYRLDRNLLAAARIYEDEVFTGLKERLSEEAKVRKEDSSREALLESMLGTFKDFLHQSANRNEYNFIRPKFLYFRAENARLRVYCKEDFIVAFENGHWKLKNFHYLQYIIMFYNCSYLFADLSFVNDEEKRNEILLGYLNRLGILMDNISFLSKNSISSIIILTHGIAREDSNGEKINWFSLNREEASEILDKLPLNKRNLDSLYLSLIRDKESHLNICDINTKLLSNICSVDGAVIMDDEFNIVSFGEIIDGTDKENQNSKNENSTIYGTGTNACQMASKENVAIKISEDGDVKVYLFGEHRLTV